MVFTKLSLQEKDAFFGLLDEYFQSRPELFGQNGLAGTGSSTTGGAPGRSNNPYAANMQPNSADAAHAAAMVGRVAAATLAFSGGGASGQSQSQSQSQPQSQSQSQPPSLSSLSRRLGGGASDMAPGATRTSLERAVSPGSEVDKLTSKKVSAFSAFRKPEKLETPGVMIPPAFAAPKSTFGPPPVRRPTSETSIGSGGTIGTHLQRQAAPAPAPEVAQGDWAEVLYEYRSKDPGDLEIEAGMRVLITDKSSDDWWTGQVEGQGRRGLFPASYVKLL